MKRRFQVTFTVEANAEATEGSVEETITACLDDGLAYVGLDGEPTGICDVFAISVRQEGPK